MLLSLAHRVGPCEHWRREKERRTCVELTRSEKSPIHLISGIVFPHALTLKILVAKVQQHNPLGPPFHILLIVPISDPSIMAFSFGAPAAPAAGSSGTTGGFSFGATTAQQQQQNKPATGGFSFGANRLLTTSSTRRCSRFDWSLRKLRKLTTCCCFSCTCCASACGSTGGLFSFGAKPAAPATTSQPQQAAGSTSTFGSSTGGFSAATRTRNPLLQAPGSHSSTAPTNTQQQQQASTSLFGAPASSFATTSAQQPVAQTQFASQQQPTAQPDKKLGISLSTKLEQIRAAWDTSNAANCRFAYYFYNNAGNAANLKLIQGRRPDAVGPMHDQLWMAAVRENPDPNRLYPVLALGFNDLKKRIESQEREAQRQRALLQTLATRLSALEQKHSLSNSVMAQKAQTRQAQFAPPADWVGGQVAAAHPGAEGESTGRRRRG